ncbi:hypothetical protein A6A05_04930 [Magnetospirillum moscoviense]|uniref:Uncharacterized protein n=1 Tax=Magnetospirillum moscoviense TaxID=1437059 RepID=A0A178M6X8_9PROT|nr:hypothetical protein A6A05_04930 [Magnetospirillum moscoviense]
MLMLHLTTRLPDQFQVSGITQPDDDGYVADMVQDRLPVNLSQIAAAVIGKQHLPMPPHQGRVQVVSPFVIDRQHDR